MRPKKHETTGEEDLFWARLDQIINMKHELVQLAGKLDWEWLDGEIAPLFSDKGRPAIESCFVLGLLLLKHIFALSDEEVCERWVYDPYFQHFTGEEFFQHAFPHERSDLSHWRKRLGEKLELLLAESLRVAHEAGALRTKDLERVTVDTTVQPKAITFPTDGKLLHAAIRGLNRLAGRHGVEAAAVLSAHRQAGRHDGRAMPTPSSSTATADSCASCALGSGASSATSAARPPASPTSKPRSNGRSRAPNPNSSVSAAGSFIPSTRPRSNASARARLQRPTSSASRPRSSPPMPARRAGCSCCTPRRCPAT